MKRTVGAVLFVLVLAGVAWILLSSGSAEAPAPFLSRTPALPAVPVAPASPASPAALVPAPAAPSTPAPPSPETEPPLRVRTNVPGAEVMVWLRLRQGEKDPPALRGTADREGTVVFVLPVPRDGIQSVNASASARGWTTADGQSRGSDIELDLEPGFEVSGRVTFPDGRPARAVRLSARGRQGTATDEAGRYSLGGLPEGEVAIESRDLGEERKVAAGTTGVDFVMKRHIVQFRIRDEEGQFVALECFDLKVTGDGGFWEVGGHARDEPISACAAPGAQMTFACRSKGYMNEVVKKTFGQDPDFHEIVVVLKRPGPPGTIAIRVRTDADPQPVGVGVTLFDSTGLATADYSRLKVDIADGKGTLTGIPAGTYRAEVSTGHRLDFDDYGLPATTEVTVEAGKETPLEAVIPSGGRLTVVVKDTSGKVIPAGHLELVDLEGKEVKIGFGNETEDGMSFPPSKPKPALGDCPVAPGRYVVHVVRYVKNEKTVPVEKEVTILSRRTVEVEITLPE